MTISQEQFNLLATKDDLKQLEDAVDSLADLISQVAIAVADLVKKVDDLSRELATKHTEQDRFETRIAKLETVVLE